MDDLQTILDGLQPDALSYVWERSRHLNDSLTSVLKRIGISRAKFYEQYDANQRDYLDSLALQLARDTHYQALQKASEHASEAMDKLVSLMNTAESDQTKLNAAKVILEYALGKPTSRVDVTSNGETVRMYGNVSPDDWDDDEDE